MGFREWLLKEDPDEVIKTDKFHLTWDKGFTFFIFEGYCIHAKFRASNHPELMTDISGCLRTIKNALAGSASAKEVDDCIAPPKGYYKTHGTPSRRAMELIVSTFEALPDPDSEASEFEENLRSIVLDKNPDVIMGRIWPEEMVISFWNEKPNIMKNRHHILGFVRATAGDEKDFEYDLEGGLMSYDEFVGGGVKKANPLFDPSKVHTMPPGPVKSQLMGAMGFMRSKPVDIRTRAAREGD